jgi:hypothetical protein
MIATAQGYVRVIAVFFWTGILMELMHCVVLPRSDRKTE